MLQDGCPSLGLCSVVLLDGCPSLGLCSVVLLDGWPSHGLCCWMAVLVLACVH